MTINGIEKKFYFEGEIVEINRSHFESIEQFDAIADDLLINGKYIGELKEDYDLECYSQLISNTFRDNGGLKWLLKRIIEDRVIPHENFWTYEVGQNVEQELNRREFKLDQINSSSDPTDTKIESIAAVESINQCNQVVTKTSKSKEIDKEISQEQKRSFKMDQQLSAIATAESDYDNANVYLTEVIVLLEAIDTLRGTGEYHKTSELTLNDAALILLEAPEIEDADRDIEKVREDCVEREANLREGMLAIRARINSLKVEAYDRTEKYLTDRLNEESDLSKRCKTMRRIQEVLVNDPPEIDDLDSLTEYIDKVNKNR